ncbi:MAG: response regulator transcription factor [Phormidesmis sp. RL_2_1]|nr:response regulator transcription factor [Phormidesmis sp. RL_2_1]
MGGDRYQVIAFNPLVTEADLENSLSTRPPPLGHPSLSEVTHFTVNGQLCSIVAIGDEKDKKDPIAAEIQALLTERELQIAALVAFGKVNKQIAKQLHISEWTVATYLRRMFAKLRVDSRAALVYRCAPLIRKFQELSTSVNEQS